MNHNEWLHSIERHTIKEAVYQFSVTKCEYVMCSTVRSSKQKISLARFSLKCLKRFRFSV